MFRWYAEADVCFAYLSDISVDGGVCSYLHENPDHAVRLDEYMSNDLSTFPPIDVFTDCSEPSFQSLSQSRWFSRGWTLQELIAPHHVVFYDNSWREIGDRESLSGVIQNITGIDSRVFGKPEHLEDYTIAQRMSWAAHRTTTRDEDEAYSLLGVFNINMPMLYGEGKKAFIRLQEAIVSSNSDQSIFAWEDTGDYDSLDSAKWMNPVTTLEDHYFARNGQTDDSTEEDSAILARSASAFKCSRNISCGSRPNGTFAFTNTGLQAYLPMVELSFLSTHSYPFKFFGAILNCRIHNGWIALGLLELDASGGLYRILECHGSRLQYIDALTAMKAEPRSITIVHGNTPLGLSEPIPVVLQLGSRLRDSCRAISSVFPSEGWEIFQTHGDFNESRLRGAHFNPPHEKARAEVHGAIVIEAARKDYPLQIGVRFYYRYRSYGTFEMRVRLLYHTTEADLSPTPGARGNCTCETRGCEDFQGLSQQLLETPCAESLARGPKGPPFGYLGSSLVAFPPLASIRAKTGGESPEPRTGIELEATFKHVNILDKEVLLLELEGDTESPLNKWDPECRKVFVVCMLMAMVLFSPEVLLFIQNLALNLSS